MKIRNTMTGEVLDAELRTDHAASSYGQLDPVLEDTGETADRIFYEVLDLKGEGKERR